MAACWCCGRLLTDPLSIKLGIGPVCAVIQKKRQVQDANHSLFAEPAAAFEWCLSKRDSVLFIVDQCAGGRSVTNDIDRVLATIAATGINLDTKLIVYRDRQRIWDGVILVRGRFAGFIPLRQETQDAARRSVLEWARRR